jgi:hypothetical protein
MPFGQPTPTSIWWFKLLLILIFIFNIVPVITEFTRVTQRLLDEEARQVSRFSTLVDAVSRDRDKSFQYFYLHKYFFHLC